MYILWPDINSYKVLSGCLAVVTVTQRVGPQPQPKTFPLRLPPEPRGSVWASPPVRNPQMSTSGLLLTARPRLDCHCQDDVILQSLLCSNGP